MLMQLLQYFATLLPGAQPGEIRVFEKTRLLEDQNLIFLPDGFNLTLENSSICSSAEIQSMNLKTNQLIKLGSVKMFPLLCVLFSCLSYLSCEYEGQKVSFEFQTYSYL